MTSMAMASFPELELIDKLIANLEKLIAEADEKPLTIDSSGRPRRSQYRVLNTTHRGDRKAKTGDAVYLDNDRLTLYCVKTEVVKGAVMEITIQAEKSGRGESFTMVKGKALGLKRVRGGYEIDIEVIEMRNTLITPGQKLRECLAKHDAAGWNRWCQDIKENIELIGMDMTEADLAGYDLCCSDLTGSNLTGANLANAILAGADLAGCKLDQAIVTGADFFHARLARNQAWVLPQSGMIEVESVIFEG
jgi:Uncharacterized low-complexity proteins